MLLGLKVLPLSLHLTIQFQFRITFGIFKANVLINRTQIVEQQGIDSLILIFRLHGYQQKVEHLGVKGSKQVAYVRLRMGNLTVRVPDVDGELVYHKNYENDPAKGYFYTQEERMGQLRKIVKILKEGRKNANKRKRNK